MPDGAGGSGRTDAGRAGRDFHSGLPRYGYGPTSGNGMQHHTALTGGPLVSFWGGDSTEALAGF
jgi:hypothetical protein